MIPFFLRHYEPLVDRIVVFDDGSTDRSRELLATSPKVELRQLTPGPSSMLMQMKEMNRCWKESRSCADWVITADFDEFLYHPRLRDYLAECQRSGCTILQAIGLDMVSADFPDRNAVLTESVRRGVPLDSMDKPAIFDPNAIDEINYDVGRHFAFPTGRVVFPTTREVKLLHYKYLGADYIVSRTIELRNRKTPFDREKAWNVHLDTPPEKLRLSVEKRLRYAPEVI